MSRIILCDHGQPVAVGCYKCDQEAEASEECRLENIDPMMEQEGGK